MMKRRGAVLTGLVGLLGWGPAQAAVRDAQARHDQIVTAVRARETAFAQTMAVRDHDAFGRFVSAEAVFLNGGDPLVGRAAIVRHWQRFYEGEKAPFSWKPDTVVVLGSGRLAQTGGPVADADGHVGSRFQSVWRLEDDGQWRVVFDSGYRLCECPPAQ